MYICIMYMLMRKYTCIFGMDAVFQLDSDII